MMMKMTMVIDDDDDDDKEEEGKSLWTDAFKQACTLKDIFICICFCCS